MKSFISRLSLTKQFLVVSFPIILAGTLVIGYWVGKQIEDSVVHRIGGVTALYVDSFLAPHVQTLFASKELSSGDQEEIALDLANTPLGKKIVSLKIWRQDGYVLFSTEKNTVGQKFPIDEGLAIALQGNIFSEISERTQEQQARHGQPLPRLIETYTPIHGDRNGGVLAVAEYYQKPDEVDREVAVAQRRGWMLVAGTTLTMYLLLLGVVRGGSKVISEQQHELGETIQQLTSVNETNHKLQARVLRAAERSTALHETFLQRVSADIHDGPGQNLGFALMQLKNFGDASLANPNQTRSESDKSVSTAILAVQSALTDLRAISTNLELPHIETLTVADIAARVIREFQVMTGATVKFENTMPDNPTSFRAKVTLYRVLQECLANTFRHAKDQECSVTLTGDNNRLTLDVQDKGPGFDPEAASKGRRLGLRGMRQRVEIQGGSFNVISALGMGTQIRISLPLIADETDDE
jgi:signal transduction histidine kinase